MAEEHPTEAEERWLPAVGYDGWYGVSDRGRVRRDAPGGKTWPGRLLRQATDELGRPQVNLCRAGRVRTRRVCRLVLEAFIGPCPPGMECCHGDDNPANNVLPNLRWGTRQSNRDDMVRNGHSPRGERHWRAKLTADGVREIRRRVAAGESHRAVARDLGVGQQTVSMVVAGKRWAHVE